MKSAQWPKAGLSVAWTASFGFSDLAAEIVIIIALDLAVCGMSTWCERSSAPNVEPGRLESTCIAFFLLAVSTSRGRGRA